MGIQVGDNFDHKSKKPLDARTSYSTLALMKAVSDSNINEGCLAYCEETDKYYKFLSTNTVDTTTGKWREFSSGGGGSYTAGDGIVIDDDEISTDSMQSGDIADVTYPLPSPGPGVTSLGGLTDVSISDPQENETLLYNPTTQKWENGEGGKTYTAGDGINIDANDEISTDSMQSGDMDEVVDTLPGIASRYHKFSTEEQIVGEWLNGETLFQRTLVATMSNQESTINIDSSYLIKFIDGGVSSTNGTDFIPVGYGIGDDSLVNVYVLNSAGKIYMQNAYYSSRPKVMLTIRYTKS